MRFFWGLVAAGSVCLAGCVTPPVASRPMALEAVRFDQIPGWQTDHLAGSFAALRAECRRMALMPPDTVLGGEGLPAVYGGKAGQWSVPCTASAALVANDEAGIRHLYETWFQPYLVADSGLFTGYYEPEVPGSRVQGAGYTVPLLARPADLVQGAAPASDSRGPRAVGRMVGGRLVPYFSRAEIEAGAMGPAARPLLWLHDPVDLFFLQVQGSGRVRLPDGKILYVAYDGKNGRPYTPIGRVLVEQNEIAPATVSMQSIRAWLAAHPAQAKDVMDRNEDYVFFRIINRSEAASGPPGTLGVDLAPGRSVAVDPHFVPFGTPVFLDTTDPVSGTAWRHLLLAQDSGTDILGAARMDVFFGAGPYAEQAAGRMHASGKVFLLVPRPVK